MVGAFVQNTGCCMNRKLAFIGLVAGLWLFAGRNGPLTDGVYGAQQTNELIWGGDAEGGSPFVEADPRDPTHVVGFEVEVAGLLAEGLGRTPRFLQVGFTSLDAAAARGDFDIGLSGIEDSAARRSMRSVCAPPRMRPRRRLRPARRPASV